MLFCSKLKKLVKHPTKILLKKSELNHSTRIIWFK